MEKKQIEYFFETHREEYLADLARLVAIDSARGEELPGMPYGEGPARALDCMLEIAQGYGLYTENWDNRLGIVQLDASDERILDIYVHLDVVPPGEGWTVTEPFVMKEQDGRVYGRGVIDDKGPALAAVYALRAVKESGVPLAENVRIMLGCDEESGGSDLDYYLQKTEPAAMTFTPDGNFPVVNTEKGIFYGYFDAEFLRGEGLPRLAVLKGGEKGNVIPSRAELVIEGLSEEEKRLLKELACEEQEKTGAAFAVTEKDGGLTAICAEGEGGHASMPEYACNALTALLQLTARLHLSRCEGHRLMQELAVMFPHGDYRGKAAGIFMEDEISGPITVCLDVLDYDGERLHAVFDARTPLCADEDNLSPVRQKAEAAGFSFRSSMSAPHHVPEDSFFVKSLLESYELYTGKPGKGIAIGGGTYVHGVENGVAFGCAEEGVDYHMHGADEFADVELLLKSGMIFTSAILKLCEGGQKTDNV